MLKYYNILSSYNKISWPSRADILRKSGTFPALWGLEYRWEVPAEVSPHDLQNSLLNLPATIHFNETFHRRAREAGDFLVGENVWVCYQLGQAAY